MKSYLDLVPICAREHKKQNRMSIFCIALSVFLVTVIFGMADMFIRSQVIQAEKEYGKWHLAIRDISDEQADRVAERPDVACVSCYGVLNFRGDDGYTLGGKTVVIGGCDEAFLTKMHTDMIAEGTFPRTEGEALITQNAQKALRLSIGDTVSVQGPDGKALTFSVSGIMQNAANLMSDDAYGVFVSTRGFRAIYPTAGVLPADYKSLFYVQLANTGNVRASREAIARAFGLDDGQISGNTKLLSLLGQGADAFSTQIYGSAAILFVLVLLAGIIMITSSLSSNVAGRTQFFGMMRCIGATKKQVIRLVRREALYWCMLAIPLGVAAGVVIIWGLCLALRFLSPNYFGDMPAFGVSFPSILAGVVLGLLTVLLAARNPARRASKASPLAAVSGNESASQASHKAVNIGVIKIDFALGIQHAKASRKNYFLMSASFALSIILFLSFSVTIGFMNHALRPLRPWTPDLSVDSQNHADTIPDAMLDALASNPAVEKAYGRMAASDLNATVDGKAMLIHLISYENHQFGWAEPYLLGGSLDDARERIGYGIAIYDARNPLAVGSAAKLDIDGRIVDLTISGTLSDSPFRIHEGAIVICSEATLRQLTGQSGYAVIDMQLKKSATDADVDAIRAYVGSGYTFSDERLGNSSVEGTYYSFALFVYGFLALIALVAVFNIINSIALSVASRTKQYGIFRAIGVSGKQLTRMIVAEAVAYAFTGTVSGTLVGLALNNLLFSKLIAAKWGDAWRFPSGELAVILAMIACSVLLAVRKPIRQIKRMSIIDTISGR